jgi:hypothetical protein
MALYMRYIQLAVILFLFVSPVWGATETFYLCKGGDGTCPENDWNDNAGCTVTCSTAWDTDDLTNSDTHWDNTDPAVADDGDVGPNDEVILMDDGGDFTYILSVRLSGTSGNPITFKADSGDTPVIRTMTTISGNWTENVGTSEWEDDNVTPQPFVVMIDGALAEEGTFGSLTAGQWDWDTNKLYVKDDPSNQTVEVGAGSNGIRIRNYSYIDVDGITVEGANDTGFEIGATSTAISNINITNCNSQYNGSTGFNVTGDAEDAVTSVLIEDCVSMWNAGNGIYLQTQVSGTTIRRCITHHNSQSEAKIWTGGIKTIIDGGTNIVEYCESYENGRDANGTDLTDPGSDRGEGIWFDSSVGSNNVMRYNKSHDNKNSGFFIENTDDVNMYYNISYDNGVMGIQLSANETGLNDNEVYNNVSYSNDSYGIGVDGNYEAGCSGAGNVTGNLVKNNISVGNATELFARCGGENDGTNGSGNVYDYNCFGAESNDFIQWADVTDIDTYDDWEWDTIEYCGTVVGDDGCSNSVEADPLFNSEANRYFLPKYNSPVIDQGTNVSLTQDYTGSKVPKGSAQDMGVYEYTPNAIIDTLKKALGGIGIYL